MEQENKRCRAKYNKAERARITRLVELAYDNDPRIRVEREAEEAEKQKRKEEIKARKVAASKAKTDIIQAKKDAKEAEERAKVEDAKSAAAIKKASDLAYKKAIKDLIILCTATFTGSNFDRFFVEGN